MSLKTGIQAPYHTLGFAEKTSYFPAIYERIGKNLSSNYAVVYSLEPVPDEQARAAVLDKMEKCGIEDAQRYADEGLLKMVDSESIYYMAGINPERLEGFWQSYFSHLHRKLGNKAKGILGIYSAESYFTRNHHESFVAFEIMTGKTLGRKPAEFLCWYKKEWLNNLSFGQIIHLLTAHYATAHQGWRYRVWNDDMIVDLATEGTAKILGEKPTLALFETMRMRFGLERNGLVSRPEYFEDVLKMMLGEDDANSILKSITNTYRRELSFGLSRENTGMRRK